VGGFGSRRVCVGEGDRAKGGRLSEHRVFDGMPPHGLSGQWGDLSRRVPLRPAPFQILSF
jgi:hypothetical protein